MSEKDRKKKDGEDKNKKSQRRRDDNAAGKENIQSQKRNQGGSDRGSG